MRKSRLGAPASMASAVRRFQVTAITFAAAIGITVLLPVGQAAAADDQIPSAAHTTLRAAASQDDSAPIPKPHSSTAAAKTTPQTCTKPNAKGAKVCVQKRTSGKIKTLPHSQLAPQSQESAQDVEPVPSWCEDAIGQILGTRTELCLVSETTYTTVQETDGEEVVTGEADLLAINYSYTDTGLGTFAHQFEVTAVDGWGAALDATLSAGASALGACTVNSSAFPAAAITPLGEWHGGDAYFDTTATAAGAIGTCATTWTLVATNPPYPPAAVDFGFNEIRCDNATAGRAAVGCVVPWYPEQLVYSSSATPALASHVLQAQASGLPGASIDDPLTRTEDPTIIDTNRTLACGDAPSITDMSCDEYPIATSREGLSAGGTRRTFDGCQIPNVGTGTGPTGVSVCMIPAVENNSQGGTNTQFFRAWRVLDGDPFYITIS